MEQVNEHETVEQPVADAPVADAPKKFSIARVDACILRMWQKVNDKEHAVIEEIEKLLGIKD